MVNKRLILFILALAVLGMEGNVCQAEILPPDGPGQIGYRAEMAAISTMAMRKKISARMAAHILSQKRFGGFSGFPRPMKKYIHDMDQLI